MRNPAGWLLLGCLLACSESALDNIPPPRVVGVEIQPERIELDAIGAFEQVRAVVKDEKGVARRAVVEWSIEDPEVVRFETNSVTVAMKRGETRIRAAVVGTNVEAYAAVEVHPTTRRLVFLSQPGSITVGEPLGSPLSVARVDRLGTPVDGDGESIALELIDHPFGARLVGDAVGRSMDGISSFQGLTVEVAGKGLRLRATSPGLPPEVSEPFDAEAGKAEEFLLLPTERIRWGETFSITGVIRDRFGNRLDSSGGVFDLSLRERPGESVLLGGTVATSQSGIVRWERVSVETRALAPPQERCFDGFRLELVGRSRDGSLSGSVPAEMRIPFVTLQEGGCGLTAAGWVYCHWDSEYLAAPDRVSHVGTVLGRTFPDPEFVPFVDLQGRFWFKEWAKDPVEIYMDLEGEIASISYETVLTRNGRVYSKQLYPDEEGGFLIDLPSADPTVKVLDRQALTRSGDLYKWSLGQNDPKKIASNVLDFSRECILRREGETESLDCIVAWDPETGSTWREFEIPKGARIVQVIGRCFLTEKGALLCLEDLDPSALTREDARIPHPRGLRFVGGSLLFRSSGSATKSICFIDEEGAVLCRGQRPPEVIDAYIPAPIDCDGFL